MAKRIGVLQWVVVLVVGIAVVAIVLGLNLIPRLNDGQKVLDSARPAFTADRIAGNEPAIGIVSRIVDLADPIARPSGGAAAEIPGLVTYVAKQNHISEAAALKAITKTYPHTAALLGAVPLSSVTAELPKLVAFLAKTLHLSQAQVLAALKTNFPGLAQSITNLPTVTNGWDNVPGTSGLTRFDGRPAHTVGGVRNYFAKDVLPLLADQRKNFDSLDGTSKVNWIAPLLLVVGIIVIVFALLMIFLNRGVVRRTVALGAAGVVVVVGVVVVGLVLVLSLIPRLDNGQKLLDGLKPANTKERVVGARAGVNMVSAITDLADPIATPRGGAAAEVPKLIAFVSKKTGLSQAEVLKALKANFPHTTALLQAIPLSAVSAELPNLVANLTPNAIPKIPRLAQTVLAAPDVTNGWNKVPGIEALTRFDGTPVKTVPDVRTYFSADVVPVLETQRSNYDSLTSKSNIDFLGPLVLVIGIVVIVYGLLMVFLAYREPRTRHI